MPPEIEHLGSTSRISVVMDQEDAIPKIVERVPILLLN
jgi:hypothetical protein